jgi:small subunit ribosomal protein S20
MPIIKSAIKRVRQSAKRRSRNLQVKRAIHQDVRVFSDALTANDTKAVPETLRAAISEIDRAVKKGTLHRNTAARRKSSLQKRANAVLGSAPSTMAAKKAAPKTTPVKKSPTAQKPSPKKPTSK